MGIGGVENYNGRDDVFIGRLDGAGGDADILVQSGDDGDSDPDDEDYFWRASMHRIPPFVEDSVYRLYTIGFNGTSAASAMIAGAVAAVQGVFRHAGLDGCSPAVMKTLLQETGEPQFAGESQNIGPFPNLERLRSAIFLTEELVTVNGYPASYLDSDVVANADIDGDGLDDIFVSRPSTHAWYVSYNLGNGNFSSGQSLSMCYSGYNDQVALTGDLDGDGDDDVLRKLDVGGGYWVGAYNNGNGTFTCLWAPIGGSLQGFDAYDHFALGDLNNDGYADLVVREKGVYPFESHWVYAINNQDHSFAAPTGFAMDWFLEVYEENDWFGFGDIDKDGDEDLLLRKHSYIFGNGWYGATNLWDLVAAVSFSGRFTSVFGGSWFAFDDNEKMAVGDYDGDGLSDLIGRRPATDGWYLAPHITW